MQYKILRGVATLAVCLALIVVMLGAYTRLTDAGLGCPDWPGCYGHLVMPSAAAGLQEAQTSYPEIPIEERKAWTEMVHRYFASTLGALIFFMGIYVFYRRAQGNKLPWHLLLMLMILVVFQALLGMWTVTLKLLPVVVMSHLLGGILIFACLCRLRLQLSLIKGQDLPHWRPWLRVGFFIVFLQIALGGWVSSNYAGISCIGFPQCNGLWFPKLHFAEGFNLFSPIGANYQGGLLDNEIRVSIQFVHRLGAVITATYLLILAFLMLWKEPYDYLRKGLVLLILLVSFQFTLGILNVVYLMPISVAVAHNGVAALLLATIFSLLYLTRKEIAYAE